MYRIRRALVAVVATTAALGVAAGLATVPVPAAGAQEAAAKAAAPKKSRFALRGWAYATGIAGGPAASAPTGYQSIGCTTRTGLTRTNHLAKVTVPGLGTVDGLRSDVWTTRRGKVVSSWARNDIGKVTLSDSPLGSLILDAVSTTARAYHDGKRFRTSTTTNLAKLQFKPAIGPAQTFPLPTPKRAVTIPGIAKVEFAPTFEFARKNGAEVYANGLRVTLIPTGTMVKVAHSVAQISDGVVTGIFTGNSFGAGASVLGKLVNVGRTPLLKMPCSGTGGEVTTRRLVGLDLGPISVGAAVSQQRTVTNRRAAAGWERASVASIAIGDAIKIDGIVAQANVRRAGKNLKVLRRSTAGTKIGSITINGQPRELPLNQTITVPGVAKLQPRVVTKLRNGVKVVALRVTLLDGTGAVVDLGSAEFSIRRAPK